MKILIFKTDKIGDLINISSLVKNLKNLGFQIDIICSEYNSRIGHYYGFNKIYIKEDSINFYLKNRDIFKNKYDFVLQFDGSSWSFFIGLFIKAKRKYSLKYIKTKSVKNFRYQVSRPIFFYSFFYKHVKCIEDYNLKNNKDYHYLSLYYKILEYENLSFKNKKHYFPVEKIKNKNNLNLFNEYLLVHLDEKWKNYNLEYFMQFKNKIFELSKKNKIVITSNNENLYLDEFSNNKNILVIYDTKIDDLLFIAFNCKMLISFHAGFLVHISACFDKKIIDVMPKIKFNEIDRWIPIGSKYSRYDINSLNF